MKRPATDFEALRDDLHKVFDGDPWHGSSITTVLDGIDADTAALRSIPRAQYLNRLSPTPNCPAYGTLALAMVFASVPNQSVRVGW